MAHYGFEFFFLSSSQAQLNLTESKMEASRKPVAVESRDYLSIIFVHGAKSVSSEMPKEWDF